VHELLGAVLQHAGASFADVLKVTVFLLDAADRHAVNEVRKEFFGATRPASTLVQVAALAVPGLLVEVEAVAGIPGRRA
jgi:2-iminobutanoate/2-iminopropanoate deaminase